MGGVVSNNQCLPALHDEWALPLEGSEHLCIKDTNKSKIKSDDLFSPTTNDEQVYRKMRNTQIVTQS